MRAARAATALNGGFTASTRAATCQAHRATRLTARLFTHPGLQLAGHGVSRVTVPSQRTRRFNTTPKRRSEAEQAYVELGSTGHTASFPLEPRLTLTQSSGRGDRNSEPSWRPSTSTARHSRRSQTTLASEEYRDCRAHRQRQNHGDRASPLLHGSYQVNPRSPR